MEKSLEVVFDGQVLRPSAPPDLEIDRHFKIKIQDEGELGQTDRGNVWTVLKELAGSIDAPRDWSEKHDAYLYESAIEKIVG